MTLDLDRFYFLYVPLLTQLNTSVPLLTVSDSTEVKLPYIECSKRVLFPEVFDDLHKVFITPTNSVIHMDAQYAPDLRVSVRIRSDQ